MTNVEILADTIKNYGEPISSTGLAEILGWDKSYTKNAMQRVKKDYPQVHAKRGGADSGYFWVDLDTKSIATSMMMPKDDSLDNQEVSYKNSEGYNDPTPFKATKRGTHIYQKGEICQVGLNTNNLGLIISGDGNFLTILEVRQLDSYFDSRYDVRIKSDSCGIDHYVRCNRIYTYGDRKFGDVVYICDSSTMETVLDRVKVYLFNEPVSKQPEINQDSTLQNELLKQRAEIYEKAFYAVCGKFNIKGDN